MPARQRVLVVDDDLDFLEPVVEALVILGYEVTTAHDGLEALAAVRRAAPDVVLCDVQMPVCNGEELVHRIREDGRDPPVIVLMSGSADVGERAARLGVGFVRKPFDLATLERCFVSSP